MEKAKSRIVVMEGYVEYARIFPSNMDKNPDFHPTGQFNMNFYPASEEEIQKLWDAGVPKAFRGTPRLRDPKGDESYGIGKFVRLKRDNIHRIEALGGAPSVVHWTDDRMGEDWDITTDGEVGNGSKVLVKLVVYGEGDRTGSRLEKVGVKELVPYFRENSGF